jgi:hypothetical protein
MSFSSKLKVLDSFGGTDADNDPLLIECFEDHPAYLSLRSGAKHVILGRKGSGKTAVYRRILKEFPSTAIGFNFSDYPWAHHEVQKQAGVPHEQCFVESWKYFCLINLAKPVLRGAQLRGLAPDLASIRTFIKDTYGTDAQRSIVSQCKENTGKL